MELKTIKDVLDYIDCGILNNNYNSNYVVFMEMSHNFLLDSEEIYSEFQFDLLKETNLIITKLFQVKNEELKNDYFELRVIILRSLEND